MIRKSTARVSITDVAKRAKVSISTVSRVINQRSVVNTNTRQRVESAIRELGYHPNPFARGLMLRRSELVGLMLPDLHGEFYSEIIRGADAQARKRGYSLVVTSARDGGDGHALLSAFRQRTVLDGVAVMVSELTSRIQEVLGDFRLPLVVLDDEIGGAPHDSVLIDQREGALAMMHHLTRTCGARHIVFLGGLETNLDTRARIAAYREVLAEAGLRSSRSDVYYLDYQYDTAFNLALEHVRAWARRGRCVFAANDEMAAGVIAAAHARGVTVPQELPVVGFDDTRIAQLIRPPLTTVRVPMAEMGARAIDLLCDRIGDPGRLSVRLALKPKLVVRASCGAAAIR